MLTDNFKVGNIIESNNCGKYEILEEVEPRISGGKKIRFGKIKFIETGTIREARVSDIAIGKVKDPYYRNVAGVGYLGDLTNITYSKKEYDMWRTMINRCYDTSNISYHKYGGAGITVCERWHSFENFMNDLPTLIGYDKYSYLSANGEENKYQLDKDTLQSNLPVNQRVYSPQTCMLIEGVAKARMGGLTKPQDSSSQYRGVYKTKNGSYQCRIFVNGSNYFLGTYDDEIAAANMYNYVVVIVDSNIELNKVPFMSINECLSHKHKNISINLPDGVNIPELIQYNNQASYQGIISNNGYYSVEYHINGVKHNGGRYTNKDAAANAYNYYSMSNANNVPYMEPSEWLKYKYYSSRDKQPEQMYELTNESEEERKARCLSRYGVEFL